MNITLSEFKQWLFTMFKGCLAFLWVYLVWEESPSNEFYSPTLILGMIAGYFIGKYSNKI